MITGTYKATSFEVSDLHLVKVNTFRNKRNEDVETETLLFSGRMYVFSRNSMPNATLKLIQDKKHFDDASFQRIVYTDEALNNTFLLYGDNDKATDVLTKIIVNGLLQIEKRYKGKMNVSFSENHVVVSINDKKNNLQLSLKHKISNKLIQPLIDEVTAVKTFIDHLFVDDETVTD